MNDQDYFDQRANTWDADPTRINRARAVAEGIRANVALSGTVQALEYGCGTGLLSFALQPYLTHITLADSSSGMLAVLAEKITASGIENMTPLKVDFTSDPLPQTRYQLVYTLMTLHHIADTDKILADFYTLLDETGVLCVADLDQEDGSFHGPDFDGHKGFEREALAEKARRAGFAAVSFTTVFRMQKGTKYPKDYPVFLMIAKK
jgi:ubiquinone/menaquinone biosynthesis C-methylase UbiE